MLINFIRGGGPSEEWPFFGSGDMLLRFGGCIDFRSAGFADFLDSVLLDFTLFNYSNYTLV